MERQSVMSHSSVAWYRSVLTLSGVLIAGTSLAQTPPAANVTAFNPYSGAGLAAGAPRPEPAIPDRGQPRPYPVNLPAAGGAGEVAAFNPWRAIVRAPAAISPNGPYVEPEPSADLPAPPPGPIRSRVLAIPQRGDGPPPRASSVAPPAPTPAPAAAAPPAPAPQRVAAAPVPAAPAMSAQRVSAPAAVASAPPAAPAPAVAPRATLSFTAQSAELSAEARTALDQIAQSVGGDRSRRIEVRAYAGAAHPEGRKVSLARALAVRSYLIDRGVRSQIDVGAFLAEGSGGAAERVDIVAPNS